MKKKILSKMQTYNKDEQVKMQSFRFGDDIPIDFETYKKISFFLRKNLEFKKKDFKPKLVLHYYCSASRRIKAYVTYKYTTRKNQRQETITYAFSINSGTYISELKIPVDFAQLDAIEIDIENTESSNYNCLLRFYSISFCEIL